MGTNMNWRARNPIRTTVRALISNTEIYVLKPVIHKLTKLHSVFLFAADVLHPPESFSTRGHARS